MPQPENTRLIPLTQGKFAIVNAADFEWLNQWKWTAADSKSGFYAMRRPSVNGKRVHIKMHRLIAGAPEGTQVDHRDHNTLNNTRNNLRVASHGQNKQNSRRRKDNTSGFIGVSYFAHCPRKWAAQIQVDGRNRLIGTFESPEAAARARDAEAIKLHGEFAVLNFTHPVDAGLAGIRFEGVVN